MIQQTYYPFGGTSLSDSTLSGYSPLTNQVDINKDSDSGWFGWLLLIVTLIGMVGLVYWWQKKIAN